MIRKIFPNSTSFQNLGFLTKRLDRSSNEGIEGVYIRGTSVKEKGRKFEKNNVVAENGVKL